MLVLVLSVAVQAAPVSPRVLYEDKCLFCHSEEVTEEKHFTAAQWRREVNKMRGKAPLLITRRDAEIVLQYIVKTLKLVPAASGPKSTGRAPVVDALPPLPVAPKPDVPPPGEEPLRAPPETLDEPPPQPPQPPLPPEAQAAADELDEEGAALMQRRCAKCHSLQRVFGRMDSFEKSMFTLKRMRLKTGSGISKKDEERIEQFLRSQFNAGP